HLATPLGPLNSSASLLVIARRNCSSGEAHRRPIIGEEVELGEEEPSGSAKIKEDRMREFPERVKRRAAGEGRQLTDGAAAARYAGCRWEREGASPGWSRGQQGKYHWCQWE
ncbi:unnamed protein product, partial [Staurois parvus]